MSGISIGGHYPTDKTQDTNLLSIQPILELKLLFSLQRIQY